MARCLPTLFRSPLSSLGWMCAGLFLLTTALPAIAADSILFTDSAPWPGTLTRTSGRGESLFYRRSDSPSEPGAIPRLQSVVASPSGEIYFASGLDGFIWSLSGGRERLVYRHEGQIRHLSWGHDDHSLMFSVVPTPRDAEPLADGQIYSLNLRSGEANPCGTVHQRDVEGGYWGALATFDGHTYIATLATPARVYELTGDGPAVVHVSHDARILGMAFSPRGVLHLADGEHRIWWVDTDGSQRLALDVGARNVNHLAFVGVEPRGALPPIVPGIVDICPPSRLPIPRPFPYPIPRPLPGLTPISPYTPGLPRIPRPAPPISPLTPRPDLRIPDLTPRIPDGVRPDTIRPISPSLSDRLRVPTTIVSPLTPRVVRPIPELRPRPDLFGGR